MPEHPDEAPADDQPADDQPADDYDVFYDAPDDSDAPAPGPSAGSGADALVSALFEAGPEAAEHLLKAAQELLLAAKAVVDAGERVLEQHRPTTGEGGDSGGNQTDDRPRVRRIDLA
ncbi:MAG: hypothetical protein ACRDY4_11215 [Acidimicrobiia bacterium]